MQNITSALSFIPVKNPIGDLVSEKEMTDGYALAAAIAAW